jgi:hypothetical protein
MPECFLLKNLFSGVGENPFGGLLTVPFNFIYHATKWALEGWSESMLLS